MKATQQDMSGGGRKKGSTPLVSRTYIARRPLAMGDHVRQVGDLVPEAVDWPGKPRQCHIDLGWIEEITLTNDADRTAFDAQWKREEAVRQEAIKNQPKAEPPKTPAPPPRPRRYLCANCQWPATWEEPPADHQWWQCTRCLQRQTISISKAGVLRLVSPGFNHNRKAPTFRQES